MEVVLKQKIIGLTLLTFSVCFALFFISNISTVKASDETKTSAEATTVAKSKKLKVNETETTTQAVIAKKTIKVNKKAKIKKIVKISSKTLKTCTFTTSKKSVATVSAKGVIKGKKKGKAIITVTDAEGVVLANIKVTVKNRFKASSLRLLSSIVYSEAGDQCYAGKKAVAIVVVNRKQSATFPNTLKGVIYEKGQFTPTVNGSFNKSLRLYDSGKMNKACIKAATSVLNGDKVISYKGNKIDMTGYYFFSGYVPKCRLEIQSHMFK